MKRILCLLLSGVIMVGTFAGCAKKGDGPAQNAGKEEPKLDLKNKPVLQVLLPYAPFKPADDPTAKYLEEATGYKINYNMLPNEDALTKLSTIIASKEKYDIMVLNKSDFDNTVDTNAYEPLDKLLPKYAADVKKKTSEGLWTNVTIGGEIKGIPEGLANENYGLTYRVRLDLLKKAGINKMPETPDELYTALKALKEKLNIIPMTSSYAIIPEIASEFGMYNTFTVIDNKIVYQAEVPGAKDYVAFMNKLFKDGLLDNEFAQNTGEVMKEKFLSGKTAIYQTAWWSEPTAYKTIMEKAPGAEVAYLNPLKDKNGKAGLPMARGVNRVITIPRVSENKEHALNYINMKLEEEIFRKANMGEEGVHYKKLGDNKYEPILPKFFDDKNNSHYFLTGSDTKMYSLFWEQTRVNKDPILNREFKAIQETASKASLYYDPTTYMQPDKQYSKLIGKVNKFKDDSIKQFITGTKPISDWDKFISELQATGSKEINEIVNKWWKEEGKGLSDKIIKK